jgi:osmoprotectant transport system permease protein
MREQLALLPSYLGGHLEITLAALIVGVGLSVPLGLLAGWYRWLERPMVGVASVVQTVPGLAMLAAMVPLLAALGLPSIGPLPAFVGLVLYSALPVLQNTVAGIRGVDPAAIEAARGLGMTRRQQLWRVELPLALPVILAGVRTATVWTVGAATLSTPVGATSLGNYIFAGLQTRNYTAIAVGCVAAAALALVLDGVVRVIALLVEQRRVPVSMLVAIPFVLVAGVASLALRPKPPIVIGAKTFTEQYILAEVLARKIHAATNLRTIVRASLGSTVAFDALRNGDLDTYVDYTGTLWTTVLHRDPPKDRRGQLDELGQALADEYGVVVVAALGFENTYALAMKADRAEALGVRSIADLRVHGDLSIGGDYEFFARPEWAAIRDHYGLSFATQRSMDPSLMYEAARNGDVDVISAYSTDGRIAAYGLAVLDDPERVIPPYDAVVLASERFVGRYPVAVDALRSLEGSIDAARMRELNRAVDERHESPTAVARSVVP